jgi:macrolide-specific efflux system membrane fusion protein
MKDKMISFKKIIDWLWKKRIVVGLAVIVLVLVRSQIIAKKSADELVTYQLQTRDLVSSLEISGILDAKERSDLHFVAASRLSWVGVKEGDRVRKWQAIASVDTRTLQKQLEQDLISFDKEFIDFDQTNEDTLATNLTFKRILEKAQFDLDNEVLDVEIRDLAIKLSSLVSPIDGVVTRVDEPNAGVNIAATDIFQIVNPETIYFLAEVDELDVSKISVGQKATIVLDAMENEKMEGTITYIGFIPIAGETGTSYKVEFSLPIQNETFKYRLGMGGEANIILDKRESVLSVPSEALIERDNKNYVDVMLDGTAERKEVVVGLETDDYFEILEGLNINDLVVIPQ